MSTDSPKLSDVEITASDDRYPGMAEQLCHAGDDTDLMPDPYQRDGIRSRLFGTPIDAAKIGRFTVLGRLGKGGMGVVYAAYDDQLDRKVAVKVLRPRRRYDAFASERMLHEARVMARLNHPNNVIVHEVGNHAGEIFIAMEFIRGCSLQQWLEPSRPWQDVLAKFLEAARGLAAAHAAGIAHRDFKPQNVMVTRSGGVKVMDFGIAHMSPRNRDSGLIDIRPQYEPEPWGQHLAGTPAYMAPEQIRGQETTFRCDQFSFCVALHEALYGYRPFHGDTPLLLFESVLHERLDHSPPAHSNVPAWVYSALLRGLSRDPAHRWPDMFALIEALSHDPHRVFHHRVGWAAALVSSLTLAASGAFWETPSQMCHARAEQAAAAMWETADRELLAQRGSRTAHARKLVRHFDRYRNAWASMHEDTCNSHADGRQSDYLFDLRTTCLDQARAKFQTATTYSLYRGPSALDSAFNMVASLPDISACGDAPVLLAHVPPPEDRQLRDRVDTLRHELARLRTLSETESEDPALLREAVALLPRADETSYQPVRAEAWLVRGTIELMRMDGASAAKSLERARQLSLVTGNPHTHAEALAKLVYAYSELLRDELKARSSAEDLAALAPQLKVSSELRWLIENNLAIAAENRGDLLAAETGYQRALRARHDRRDLLVARTLENLSALMRSQGDEARGLEYAQQARTIAEEFTGPDHPAVLPFRLGYAQALRLAGFPDEATGELHEFIASATRHGQRRELWTATALRFVAELELERGRDAQALAAARESLAIFDEHGHGDSHFAIPTYHVLGDAFASVDPMAGLAHHRKAFDLATQVLDPGTELDGHRLRLQRAERAAL